MTTGFDSPKVLIISHFVSLVAVPVSAGNGTKGNKLICKETNLCKCRVLQQHGCSKKTKSKIGESPHQLSQSTPLVRQH